MNNIKKNNDQTEYKKNYYRENKEKYLASIVKSNIKKILKIHEHDGTIFGHFIINFFEILLVTLINTLQSFRGK